MPGPRLGFPVCGLYFFFSLFWGVETKHKQTKHNAHTCRDERGSRLRLQATLVSTKKTLEETGSAIVAVTTKTTPAQMSGPMLPIKYKCTFRNFVYKNGSTIMTTSSPVLSNSFIPLPLLTPNDIRYLIS